MFTNEHSLYNVSQEKKALRKKKNFFSSDTKREKKRLFPPLDTCITYFQFVFAYWLKMM